MLDPAARDLARGKNFAALTTILPSGQPSTQVMWVDADDDSVLINTEVDRQKFANVSKDPRVTVTVIDAGNPYHYAEIRGRVSDTVTGPEARAHIDALAQRYVGRPYHEADIQSERVILKITPERVRVNG
ncbi:MAG TPA: PPOX class F420-dependent oxidoreductase [Acidimicrobiales bacterium]|nr:PPOX class F420-dependent oxidoreductase [Acidimicrobiales bacterium]